MLKLLKNDTLDGKKCLRIFHLCCQPCTNEAVPQCWPNEVIHHLSSICSITGMFRDQCGESVYRKYSHPFGTERKSLRKQDSAMIGRFQRQFGNSFSHGNADDASFAVFPEPIRRLPEER